MDVSTTPRNSDYGVLASASREFTADWSLEMFRRMAVVRAFEYRTQLESKAGNVETLIYLAAGQEAVAAAISMEMQGALVLGQHRAHATYLCFGGDQVSLVDELLGLPSGCCRGMGGSPPIHDFAKGIIGHNGLIGDQVPIAAGVALAANRPVVCFFGDGAAEEDYVLQSLGFASTRRLPLLFVCEDNDLSVLTPTRDRRTWDLSRVARGFDLEAVDIADDPWTIAHHVRRLRDRLPALINIRTCRELWHVGTGSDGAPEWGRYDLVKEELRRLNLPKQVEEIERDAQAAIEELWSQRLQKRSAA